MNNYISKKLLKRYNNNFFYYKYGFVKPTKAKDFIEIKKNKFMKEKFVLNEIFL